MISYRGGIWLVNLALLAVVAYLAAAIGMDVFKRRLEAQTPLPVVNVERESAPQPRRRMDKTEFQAVLDVNIFKAERTKINPEGTNGQTPAVTPGSQGPTAPAPANLGLTLTGTMIVGRLAFATVADGAGRNEKMYRLGECMPALSDPPVSECQPNQAKLVAVESTRIQVLYQNQRVSLPLTDKSSAPRAPAPAAVRRPVPGNNQGRPPTPTASGNRGVFPSVRKGDNIEVQVPGVEVTKAFENFSDVLKQARVVPYTGEGGPGFQIRSIRPGSIYQKIGLNNFDIIKAVNGEPITTADQAVSLLTMFRNEKEITLDIRRQGKDLKLNYVIE